MPSFVVLDGGVVESGAGVVVVSGPPGGIGAGWVWAIAAVLNSRAAVKAKVFMAIGSVAAPGGRRCAKG